MSNDTTEELPQEPADAPETAPEPASVADPADATEPAPEPAAPATVARDITCRATYDGVTYPKARVQVRTDGTGALFIPASPHKPLTLFTIDVPVKMQGGQGAALDGKPVKFTHRALGCGWPLCKSRVPTRELAKRW